MILIITLIKIFFVDGHAKEVGQYNPKENNLAWSKTIPVRFPGKPIQQKALRRINVHAAFRERYHWVQNTLMIIYDTTWHLTFVISQSVFHAYVNTFDIVVLTNYFCK